MSLSLDSEWRPIAFKEWKLVADAIVDGEQSILLRKGGISEGKVGFQWLHDRFFLFPSLFHEQAEQVLPRTDGTLRSWDKHPTDFAKDDVDDVVFSVYVETISTGRITDWSEVERLRPYHIWREEIVKDRFQWGDEPGISWATICAWKLVEPWILKDRKGFGGCRSWIGLPADEGGGWESKLSAAIPVESRCGLPNWL